MAEKIGKLNVEVRFGSETMYPKNTCSLPVRSWSLFLNRPDSSDPLYLLNFDANISIDLSDKNAKKLLLFLRDKIERNIKEDKEDEL